MVRELAKLLGQIPPSPRTPSEPGNATAEQPVSPVAERVSEELGQILSMVQHMESKMSDSRMDATQLAIWSLSSWKRWRDASLTIMLAPPCCCFDLAVVQ